MKFSIVKEKFLEPLADISGIVARKTTKPILSHALLQAGADNSLLLKGTDTEVTLQILLHELNVQDAGAITVPAAKLLDVVRHLPAQATIYCSLEKEQLLVKAAGSLFRIATLPAEDFPALAEADMERRIETESRALHDIMQKVRFSMASEDVRYYLNGMYLNIVEDGNAIHAVSTDGHRLSCARSALATPAPAGTNLIVPKKGVSELIKLLSRVSQPVVLNLGERQLSLTLGGYRLTSQLIDGTFPTTNKSCRSYKKRRYSFRARASSNRCNAPRCYCWTATTASALPSAKPACNWRRATSKTKPPTKRWKSSTRRTCNWKWR